MAVRRDNGQGTIIKRDNGTYQLKFRDGKKANGTPNRICFSGKTQAECKRKLKEYLQQKALIANNATDMTMDEYADFFLYHVKYGTIKASSFDRLEKIFRCHIRPEIGYMRISDVTTQYIQTLLYDKAFPMDGKKPLSRSSLKKIQEAFNMMFAYAVLREHINKNPMIGVILPSESNILVKEKEVKEISKSDIEEMLRVCTQRVKNEERLKYRLGPLFMFLLNTGLRIGEALALEKKDIDFEKKMVNINKTIATVKERDSECKAIKNVIVINSPKTKRGCRNVPLNEMAFKALELMLDNNERLGIKSKYIFCSLKGTLINERNAFRAFDVVLNNAGVEHYGLHSLRHTFASILLRKTKQIELVSDILGHSNTSITYNRYIHVLEEDKTKAMINLF